MTSALTEELALAFVPPAQRDEVTRNIYACSAGYVAGGGTFEQGLFDWEVAAITAAPFPAAGRILLGGAGGGRELRELIDRGYEVIAFEPAAPLAEGARRITSARKGAVVVTADYADLVKAIEVRSGPLASHLADASINGVILGWGSLSHVLREDRFALFRAIRRLSPRAPVLLSYLAGSGPIRGRRLRFRNMLARLTSRVPDSEDRFLPWAGFFHSLAPSELEHLALHCGYAVVWSRQSPCSHVLLAPVDLSPPRA